MYKWSVNWWELDSAGHHIRNAPPNLLNMLIYMFLTPGSVTPEDQLYVGQGPVQLVLILIAVVCVPWMWFGKPFYLKREASKHHYETVAGDDSDEENRVSGDSTADDDEEEEEVII
jgi:V-type H+-transporting ATPase subunit a